MTSAREAWEQGGDELLESAFLDQSKRYSADISDRSRDRVELVAVTHDVPRERFVQLHGAAVYGMWEEWAEDIAPIATPPSLITAYLEEQRKLTMDLAIEDEPPEVTEQALRVLPLTRMLSRQLLLLAPEGDSAQPLRVGRMLTLFTEVLGERAAQAGIAAGVAINLLEASDAAGHPEDAERWFAPVSAEQSVARWGAQPFWLDICKVARIDPAEWPHPLPVEPDTVMFAVRHGQPADHWMTLFTADDDQAQRAVTFHNKRKRWSGRIDPVYPSEPPAEHVWAVSELGFESLVGAGHEYPLWPGMRRADIQPILEHLKAQAD